MLKHGLSHTGAAITCLVTGQALSGLLLRYVPKLEMEFTFLAARLFYKTGWWISPATAGTLLTVGCLSFAWGVAFKALGNN